MSSLKVIAWNSQGNRWDEFWGRYLVKLVSDDSPVMGLLLESGKGSWDTNTHGLNADGINAPENSSWFQQKQTDLQKALKNDAVSLFAKYWPWADDEDGGNIRCSLGCIYACRRTILTSIRMLYIDTQTSATEVSDRPVIVHSVMRESLVIYQVHLVSRNPGRAIRQLKLILKDAVSYGYSKVLIVGDININLENTAQVATVDALVSEYRGLNYIHSDFPTHEGAATGYWPKQSELDWAFVYGLDPQNIRVSQIGPKFSNSQWGSGLGCSFSDHAVMMYEIDGRCI